MFWVRRDGRCRLAVTAADGSNLRYVTIPRRAARKRCLGSLAWAPDGRHFAYIRRRDFTPEIWTGRLDGRGHRRLAVGQFPRWSPDGRTIAYSVNDPSICCLPSRTGVWVTDARSGRTIRRLTDTVAGPLDWSPDGRRIVYSSFHPRRPDPEADLYIVRADGTGSARRLTSARGTIEHSPSWSPDGRRIALVRADRDEISVRYELTTIDPRGARAQTLLTTDRFDTFGAETPPSVSWQPRP